MEKCKICENYKEIIGCTLCEFEDCSGTLFQDATLMEGEIVAIEDYLPGWEKGFSSDKMIWLIGMNFEINTETKILKLHPIISEFKFEEGERIFVDSPYVLDSPTPDIMNGACVNDGGACMNCRNVRKCGSVNFELATCENQVPNYITFPLEGCVVNNFNRDLKETIARYAPGSAVKVEYKKETYFGVLLGESAQSVALSYNGTILRIRAFMNPCIFVPELNRVLWGSECWWGILSSRTLIEKYGATVDKKWVDTAIDNLPLVL